MCAGVQMGCVLCNMGGLHFLKSELRCLFLPVVEVNLVTLRTGSLP